MRVCNCCIFFLLQLLWQLVPLIFQKHGSYTEKLEWSPSYKQAVYFLPPQFVRQSLVNLNYSISFNTDSGYLDLAFTGVH